MPDVLGEALSTARLRVVSGAIGADEPVGEPPDQRRERARTLRGTVGDRTGSPDRIGTDVTGRAGRSERLLEGASIRPRTEAAPVAGGNAPIPLAPGVSV
jgi:hypothetical protein